MAFVIVSFAGKALFDTADLPPLTPLHHVHALSMLSWFGLFAVQPVLLARGQTKLHRRLGRLSLIVVLLFLVTAIQISILNWERIAEPLIITANLTNLILFVGLYSAALFWRKKVEMHKRLMVYATLSLIGPAAGRLPEIIDASPFYAAPIVFLFLLAPIVSEVITSRRVHSATLAGFVLAFSSTPIIVIGSQNPNWIAFLERTLG